MKRLFILAHPQARANALEAIRTAPDGYSVTLAEPRRNLAQNARMWAMLADIAGQVVWHGKRLTAEDWKAIFSSSLRKLQVVPNLDGTGFVALGTSTSRMTVREMSDLIELAFAFGAEHGVEWTDEVTA
jgi:hypothetical protein